MSTQSIETLVRREMARVAPERAKAALPREFRALGDDRYRFTIADLGITVEVDRLRRERHELIGELCVRCELPGARSVNGDVLSLADLNLSSARARVERAKLLAARANIRDLDWIGVIEDFCQRVLMAQRNGEPLRDLREFQEPRPDDDLYIEGLRLPRRHPAVFFGDGGTAKSYTALYLAGRLAQRGMKIALFDWELGGEDHRLRLRRLFGADAMPQIAYARCERPLIHEVDRLRRAVRDLRVDYAIYDSVAYACDGAPEAAETANAYFRAVRQIGCGSLHIAHVTKGENGDQKPFGSVFWHNSARSTWFVQAADSSSDTVLDIAFYNRKANLGRLERRPVAFTVTFGEDSTTYKRSDATEVPEFAQRMSVTERVTALLKRGPLVMTAIAERLDLELNTVTQAVNRELKKGRRFIVLSGEKTGRVIGLLETHGCHDKS